MNILFIGLTLSATAFLLMINRVLVYRDKINKIKNDLDTNISSERLSILLAELT